MPPGVIRSGRQRSSHVGPEGVALAGWRRAELRAHRIERLYDALLEMGRAFVRLSDPERCGGVCRLAVEMAGLRGAWIGLRAECGSPDFVGRASAGPISSLVADLRFAPETEPVSFGPISTAVREPGQLSSATRRRIHSCPAGRGEALDDGYRSTVPSHRHRRHIDGVGFFYGTESDTFGGASWPARAPDGRPRPQARRAWPRCELRGSEARFAVLFEHSRLAIAINRGEDNLYVNPAYLDLSPGAG